EGIAQFDNRSQCLLVICFCLRLSRLRHRRLFLARNYTPIPTLIEGAESSNSFSAARRNSSCWKCECSTKPLNTRATKSKPARQRRKKIKLPALRCGACREQEQNLQVRGNGRR